MKKQKISLEQFAALLSQELYHFIMTNSAAVMPKFKDLDSAVERWFVEPTAPFMFYAQKFDIVASKEEVAEKLKHFMKPFYFSIEENRKMSSILNAEDIDFLFKNLLKESGPKANEEIKTEAQAIELVKKNGNALWNMPEPLRTAKVYLEAVKQNGTLFKQVPEKFRTAELCFESVKNGWYRSYGEPLSYMPKEFITAELCLETVKHNGWALEFVPEKFRTAELCFEAVKQYGPALEFVPEEFKTMELCLEAVKSNGFALKYVPEPFKTKEFCSKALEKCMRHDYRVYGVYEYIPEALKVAGQHRRNYSSVFEKNVEELFEKEFKKIYYRIRFLTECARREGILALESYWNRETLADATVAGSLLDIGVQMCIDAFDKAVIEEYIDSWIEANCSGHLKYYERILASVIKTGILSIQTGENPIITVYKINSKVPKSLISNILNLDEKIGFLC